MNQYKYLFKNLSLLTVSNFGTKLLNFFFVPLYTRILSTAEYGTYDLLVTTVSLLIPICTQNIFESTLRFSLDKNCDHQEIFSISVKIASGGMAGALAALTINHIFGFIPAVNAYAGLFALMFAASLLYQHLVAFARGTEQVSTVAMAGVLHSAVLILLNLLFLLGLKLGLKGYLWANIISAFVISVFLFLRLKIYRYFRFTGLRKSVEKEMLAYSTPLVLNSICWWIISASDRYAVTRICGVAENGVYSVAYKIPSILAMLQTIFNSAWQLSTAKAYDKNDSEDFFGTIYRSYNLVMVLCCAILIILTRFLAGMLYAGDFYEAWKYVPFLMISVVFGALLGVFGGVFQAVKDSRMQQRTTVIGAVVNAALNLLLTAKFGPLGAAVSTMVAYCLMWALAAKYVKRYINIQICIKRDCAAYILLLAQAILMLTFEDSLGLYLVQIAVLGSILWLYRAPIRAVLSGKWIFGGFYGRKNEK